MSGPWPARASVTARRALVAFVASLVAGNGVIVVSSLVLQRRDPDDEPGVPVKNCRRVDERLLRGAAPSRTALRALADMGVSTAIDLRAEQDLDVDLALLDDLGITRHAIPIRDGQLPSEEQTKRFDEIMDDSTGLVFVHCGAGVGRTGAMTAYHRNRSSETRGIDIVREMLSVGPPSLEQLAFCVTTRDGYRRPGVLVTAASRTLDAPRRIWHHLQDARSTTTSRRSGQSGA